MVITFLGTGTSQGVPVIACECEVCKSNNPKDNRLRSSIHIASNHSSFVIDTGPDFRQQMLRENISHVDAVVFTHEHKDHIAGLDDIRAFNFKQKSAIDIYSTERVQQALKREFAYVFSDEKYPGIPELNLISIYPQVDFKINKTNFKPISLLHANMPVLGFKIDGFTYITDANYIAESEIEKIKNCDVLVLNALRKEQHISHFTLYEAVALAQKINAKQTYFTHISHQLGSHDLVCNELPNNISLAYDGLKIKLQ